MARREQLFTVRFEIAACPIRRVLQKVFKPTLVFLNDKVCDDLSLRKITLERSLCRCSHLQCLLLPSRVLLCTPEWFWGPTVISPSFPSLPQPPGQPLALGAEDLFHVLLQDHHVLDPGGDSGWWHHLGTHGDAWERLYLPARLSQSRGRIGASWQCRV